jgi:hypothetical protein
MTTRRMENIQTQCHMIRLATYIDKYCFGQRKKPGQKTWLFLLYSWYLGASEESAVVTSSNC